MGDFNHKGNISNLPIEYGDNIVVMVGLRQNTLDHFSLGFSFTPITLPIYGTYNDYGGIENVKNTPCTKYIEDFFGISAEKLVKIAERVEGDCENQITDEYKKVMDKIKPLLKDEYIAPKEYTLGYFMEHEKVFNKMVELGNISRANHGFWNKPKWTEEFLKELGYTKNVISESQYSHKIDNANWVHNTLPELLSHDGYFYLQSEPNKDYEHALYPTVISDLCTLIGCDIPEKYKQSWFEWRFEEDMKISEKPEPPYDKITGKDPDKDAEFIKNCLHEFQTKLVKFRDVVRKSYFINNFYDGAYGLFYDGSYSNAEYFALVFDTKNNKHLCDEYKKEFVEFASFISSMKTMNMTWGITNYYSQDVSYEYHKAFIESCNNIINEKIKQKEEDW